MDKNTALWRQYYERVSRQPHHPLTEFAAARHAATCRVAIDCGCGTGSDTAYLSHLGYRVHPFDINPFDINPDAIDLCRHRFGHHPGVEVSLGSFESFDYPRAGLIIANASLYFAEPTSFADTWLRIADALESGGIFAGHFMGPEDDWASASRHTINALARHQVEALFTRFDILRFSERNEPGQTALGKSKHWHTYSVVAVRRG
ncbi:class I SAM-dependent methyltransferase [Zobellella iuensis]|uniref:Class I SAM-dependent methyltransferase n=1 Tax=Zobellella iuensis TaxID=2803811 RepID=A0ABS1QSF1_9GAMM|nr:class I SAM-dependent methyltransferase [Zobellella iuensis]